MNSPPLSLFELVALLLTATAASAWFVRRFLPLPANIGMLFIGLAVTIAMVATELLLPDTQLYAALAQTIAQVDFYEAFMHGMLAFLLFAGALHVDLSRLRARAASIGILATVGVVLSALIVALGMWGIAQALALPLPFEWALVFGAIVAPTDPVAVLSTLKSAKVSEQFEIELTGEALFNDGVGVVLFSLLLSFALSQGDAGPAEALGLFAFQAGAGGALGLAAGYLAYRGMHSIDDYPAEVMISLALVCGTYALAERLEVSGPIAVVVAGVLTGNRGAAHAMSDTTRRYLFGFWTLVDEILNAVLFLLIGLEVLVLGFDMRFGWVALAAVPIVLAARVIAVSTPVLLLGLWQPFGRGTIPVLVWGGIRGGISIALALSLPADPSRTLILHATYAVVLFSIIVQGLSLGWVMRRIVGQPAAGR